MAMRSQVYEWSNIVDTPSNTSTTRRKGGRFGAYMGANSPTSIFIGGIGNNITKPANTNATQFVVIEDLACSPHLGMALQVTINTTDYFQTPDTQTKYTDGTYAGVSGLASPYPRGASLPGIASVAPTAAAGDVTAVSNSFNLYPSIYVLPGQTWDVKATLNTANGVNAAIHTGVTFDATDVSDNDTLTLSTHGLALGQELYVSAGNTAAITTNLGIPATLTVGAVATNTITFSVTQDTTSLDLAANSGADTDTATTHVNGDGIAAFVKYTLYDGPDALIANKLLEMGVTVNPNNVDWYKRTLIEQGGVA